MDRTFSETLSALRRGKNVSQRAAAAALHISQALLSHYENGAREPGLGFVCRACDYYGVTADYLLCRSDRPDGTRDTADAVKEFLERMHDLMDSAENALGKLEGK